jgi:hypothetical protein
MDIIQQEIEAEDKDMISEILDLKDLEKEYENNEGFLKKIKVKYIIIFFSGFNRGSHISAGFGGMGAVSTVRSSTHYSSRWSSTATRNCIHH